MNPFRHAWLALVFLLSIGPVLANQRVKTEGNEPVVLGFGVQPAAYPIGLLTEVMRRDRILERELRASNIRLDHRPFSKGNDITAQMHEHRLALGTLGDMPALISAANDDTLIIALMKQSSSQVVGRDLRELMDLRGKRVGFAPLSTAHYVLHEGLASAGLSEADIVLVKMDITEMPEALESGGIDAFAGWEPAPTAAHARSPRNRTLFRGLSTSYLAIGRRTADAHPEATRQILASYVRALNWLKTPRNLKLAAEWALSAETRFSNKPSDVNATQLTEIVRREILGVPSAPLIPRSDLSENGRLAQKLDFLRKQKKVSAESSWHRVSGNVRPSFLSEVFGDATRYQLRKFDYSLR